MTSLGLVQGWAHEKKKLGIDFRSIGNPGGLIGIPHLNTNWVVSTHLKNISQIGAFPQVGVKIVKIKNVSNHHLD